MSAYLVDKKVIDALVQWASRPRYLSPAAYYWPEYKSEYQIDYYRNQDEIGQKLWCENHRSVNFRYSENTPPPEYKFQRYSTFAQLTPVQIIKACDCWRYQSCETPDHADTEAWHIITDIRERAIDELPGYDAAEWGVP